jgi:Na+/H+ antiporter NhaD/arsenite permease-like protein
VTHLLASAAPPTWTVVPFALMLLAIAFVPLRFPHWWEHNRNKLILSAVLGVPTALYLGLAVDHGGHELIQTTKEYVAFIVLLGSLYVISGGIYLRGSLAGTPLVNTGFMAIGAAAASFIGTTGASMVLIRPLLRANETRRRKAHIVIFFIFIVSNIGGCLTPLGDPPLFLGFLRGVPFLWTFALWKEWLLMNAVLLVLFNMLDQRVLAKEERERAGAQLEEVQKVAEPLSIQGKANVLLLLGVVAVIFCVGRFGPELFKKATEDKARIEDLMKLAQVVGMLILAGLSLKITPKPAREGNKFTWAPIVEVAYLFAGIFATMIPALMILQDRGKDLPIREPWHFFWATGILSSFLDNAPTYLTYTSAASGLMGTSAGDLSGLLATPLGTRLLTAISLGAVFMGANTYIGNGPNFMVKAIAEEAGVKMPGFVGYMKWSGAILIPLFILVTFIFFRG